ncbi:MAG: hypothetical protein AB7G93_18370 [Bdellovibrionales bacterium]
MERSFRAILNEFLEEKSDPETLSSAKPAAEPSRSAPPIREAYLHFHWHAPERHKAKKAVGPLEHHGYPKAKPPPSPLKRVPACPKREEPLIPLRQLRDAHRRLVQGLIALGAGELVNGISATRLKKAHRRLARQLHPDAQHPDTSQKEKERSRALFMNLQSTYEALAKALPGYTLNASACDNESASAPDCPRRDAA